MMSFVELAFGTTRDVDVMALCHLIMSHHTRRCMKIACHICVVCQKIPWKEGLMPLSPSSRKEEKTCGHSLETLSTTKGVINVRF